LAYQEQGNLITSSEESKGIEINVQIRNNLDKSKETNTKNYNIYKVENYGIRIFDSWGNIIILIIGWDPYKHGSKNFDLMLNGVLKESHKVNEKIIFYETDPNNIIEIVIFVFNIYQCANIYIYTIIIYNNWLLKLMNTKKRKIQEIITISDEEDEKELLEKAIKLSYEQINEEINKKFVGDKIYLNFDTEKQKKITIKEILENVSIII
jgi:hypothetical protein